MLCAAGDKYVVCYNPALVEDKSRVNESYLSFENHPKPGRCMRIGSKELRLSHRPNTTASPKAPDNESVAPVVKPNATDAGVVTPVERVIAVPPSEAVSSPQHASISGGNLKTSRSDVQKILEHARNSAEKLEAMSDKTTYVHEVERFGMLMYDV